MALIKCSECGKEISSKAKSCPNCGCPINDEITLPKKKIIIKKCFHLALRTSVFIDNQPVGEIGVGANKTIELELPSGTHYIGLNTGVRHGDVFTPMAVSNASDGKQFIINENDEIIEIEILAKGSWSNSTGRCIVGNIRKYDENTISTKEIETSNIFEKHKALIISLIGIGIMLASFYVLHLNITISMLFTLLVVIIIALLTKKK